MGICNFFRLCGCVSIHKLIDIRTTHSIDGLDARNRYFIGRMPFRKVQGTVKQGDELKNMCDVLDTVEQKGKKIGEEIGEMKRAKKIAVNMKARGYSNEDISDMIEVDIKIVES